MTEKYSFFARKMSEKKEEEIDFDKKLIDYLYKMGFESANGDEEAKSLFNSLFEETYGETLEYYYGEIKAIVGEMIDIDEKTPQHRIHRKEYELKEKVKEIVQVCYKKISENILAKLEK